MGIWMPYYSTAPHIYVPGTKNNLHPQFFWIFVVKWMLEKYGIQDIIIIEIYSLNIVQNRKAHIPFFSHLVFSFSCRWDLYLHSHFQLSWQIQYFQGLNCDLGSAVYAHPARTGGKFFAGFRPSSSIVCFPCVSRPFFLHEHVGN